MAWSGEPCTVTPEEIRATLKVVALERGFVVKCPCGGSRYCPNRSSREDARAFLDLHLGCRGVTL